MLNAVRDNPERVEFIGYNTQRVRYFAFIIAGFFAGIGGGLTRSTSNRHGGGQRERDPLGGYLLFTFLGGRIRSSLGPIIGAVLLVFASVLLSELSKAWLLYLGLVFLFMVMFAPGGVASLIMMNRWPNSASCAPCCHRTWRCLAGLVAVLGAGLHGRDDLPPAAQRSPGARIDPRAPRPMPRLFRAGLAPGSCC